MVNLSFDFDSRPVLAPKEIYASSNSPSNVNLFWSQSPSIKQKGLAGYIVRYIDPTSSATHVIYLNRFLSLSDTSSSLINGKYNVQTVTAPVNVNPPQEKEYTFWVKAIRKDSLESDDSIGITWSGAERLSTIATLDTGIYLGTANFAYVMQQTDPNGPALFQITQSGGNFIIVGKNSTQFANQIDTSLNLDRNYLSKPFAVSDFTQSQITFPSSTNTSTIIYAYFPGNVYVNRARLLFTQIQDTVTHLTTNQIQASFQPQESAQLPFF